MSTTNYNATQKSTVLVSATTTAFKLPSGSKEHLFRLANATVDWEFGFDEAQVTAGEGMPMSAGEAYTIDSPVASNTTLYARQSSGGPIDMRWAYLYPARR